MYLLVMVLDDVTHLDGVLEAWTSVGVRGITIIESTGANRVLQRVEARPAFAGFGQIFGAGRIGHNTMFAVIDSLDTAEAAVAATEALLGDLTQPHTGIIFTVPVARSWGLADSTIDETEDRS